MLCCGRERESEGKKRGECVHAHYYYKLTSLRDHRPNTDLHKQTIPSSNCERKKNGNNRLVLTYLKEERKEKGDSFL
jgi:hypothetical protein